MLEAPLSGASRQLSSPLSRAALAPLSVLALSAACGGTSPARVGGSPLSLAALAGVSTALPQGEPSLRPWVTVKRW